MGLQRTKINPIIEQKQFNKSIFSKFYHQYLGGNSSSLLSYFMEEEKIDIKELEEMVKSLKN